MPSTSACAASALCVTIAIVRRSRPSAITPAQAPSSSIGSICSASVMPTVVASPVSR